MSIKPRILVTAAAGHTGSAAAIQLLAKGFPVRAFVRRRDARATALEQAGAYIGVHRLTLAGYREQWRDRHDHVMSWFDERLMRYRQSVATTWQLSVNQLTAPARRSLKNRILTQPKACLAMQGPPEHPKRSPVRASRSRCPQTRPKPCHPRR